MIAYFKAVYIMISLYTKTAFVRFVYRKSLNQVSFMWKIRWAIDYNYTHTYHIVIEVNPENIILEPKMLWCLYYKSAKYFHM